MTMYRHLLSCCVFLCFATVASRSQAQTLQFDPFGANPFNSADVIVEYEAAMAGAAETSEQSETAAATSEDAEQKAADKRKAERLAAIKKLVFDRRPSAILKLWSAPEQDETEQDETEADAEDDAAVEEKKVEQQQPTQEQPAESEETLTEEEKAQQAKEQAEKLAKEKEEQERKEKERLEKEQFAETTKTLTESVTRGDWDQFAQTLNNRERLSGDEAVAAYDRLLDQLAARASMNFDEVVGLSAEMKSFMKSILGNRKNNPAIEYAEQNIINVQDIVEIIASAPAEIREGADEKASDEKQADTKNEKPENASGDESKDDAPAGLKAEQLRKLAGLVRICIAAGSPVEEFIDAMKEASDELLPKQNIAMLLSFSSCDDKTADFLPSSKDAIAAANIDALNLLAKHYLALYKDDPQESLRVKAWENTLAALEISDDEPEKKAARTEALTRAVMLAPKLADDLGQQWLRESFTKHAERGQELVAKLGTSTAQRLAQMPQDANTRGENLKLQSAAVQAFLETDAAIDTQWTEILNLLASNWLKEAGVTQQHSASSRYGSSMRRDRYGNLYYVEESVGVDQAQQMALRRINPVKVETILDTTPTGDWFDTIDPGLQSNYTTMMCRLWLKVNEPEKAFPYIETLAKTNPETARELAEEFLRVWTKDHNPNQERQRTNYYMFIYGYEQKADKIPLTRSKQERNLAELSSWIERLSALPLDEDLDENLLVGAFMTCHSVAEVYDVQDIEKVFGAWGSIEAGTMARLIDQMRQNLAGIWRDPNVQRDNKTNRKKKDIQAEVVRGYDVAESVLDRALKQHPGNWQLLLSKACILHDENDFIQEVDPSSDFSKRRQAAFDVFVEAANAYVDVAPELPEREQSNEAFDRWFYASLGATDLGGISENNRPDWRQIERIKATLDSFEGDVGKVHREKLANSLFTRMSAVSPACKFRYLEAGFQLVDENDPKAVEARKVYDYYKDLVTELELVSRIDGDARVGHTEPFGVYVDLRHTKELERESGGFSKYLQNQKSGSYYSYNYGRPTEDYRDKFEDASVAALEDQFEILSVTFNHPETKSRDVGNGWRVTPYAYLLLKARGPEVDRLPALKIDLDFLDTSGYVALPIESSPIPIDADESAPSKTGGKLDMVQLLDERQSAEGKLIVETRVTGRGLVPAIDQIVQTTVPGFELVDVEDSDVSVIEFDKESVEPIVLSERTWTLKYSSADPAAPAPDRFTFPIPVAEIDEVTYQRYVDADLEDVESTVSLVQDYGSNKRAWTIIGLCVAAGLILLASLIVAIRSSRGRPAEVAEANAQAVTPFGLLTQLRNAEQHDSISEDRRSQLASDISAIESHYFAGKNGKAAPDLTTIADRWASVL